MKNQNIYGTKAPRQLPNGRKFFVVILAAILLGLGMIAGVYAAQAELDLAWLSVTLPILASVFPTYIGMNAVQKRAEASVVIAEAQAAQEPPDVD